MPSPIEILMDRVEWRCAICQAPAPGGKASCRCWVRVFCSECGAVRMLRRTPDLFDFDQVEIICPDCKTPKPGDLSPHSQ